MKNNEYKYNHFLQKGFVKNFAVNGKVKWKKYQTEQAGVFDINKTENKDQPIAKEWFHSKATEKGMNLLEDQGLQVVRKIAQQSNFQEKIELTRKELVTLKFFSSLSSVRTQKLRNNIKDKNGDSIFNSMIKKDGRNPQEIQEEQISIILEYFDNFIKTGSMINIQKDFLDLMNVQKFSNESKKEVKKSVILDILMKEGMTVKSSMTLNIKEKMDSRLMIFKFDESKLMLQEAMNFNEFNSLGGNKYSFMPIAPNVGIMFYFDPLITRGSIPTENSSFFKNDIALYRHENTYKNIEIIKEKQLEYIKKQNPKSKVEADYHNKIFHLFEVGLYYDFNDLFIYDVLKETAEIADICNAMALVHSKNQIIVYQDEDNITDAEIQIIKRNIFRAEDYQ